MRILMLSQFYTPVVGGQERMVENLSVGLARHGHHVAVATLWHDGLPRFEVVNGVHIHRVRGTVQRMGVLFSESERRHTAPAPDPETVLGLRSVVARERPDVVHAHDWLVHSFVFVPEHRRASIPLVLSLHDHSLVCATKRLMYGTSVCSGPELGKCIRCAGQAYGRAKGAPVAIGLRLLGPRVQSAVSRFLPVSESVARLSALADRGLPFEVLPNFIPDRVMNQAPAANRAEPAGEEGFSDLPRSDFLLFVGDATTDKGVDVLLEAHRRIGSQPLLAIIGRPASCALNPPPPNVLVLGSRPHEVVLEAWRRCSVAVIPSVWAEPFGLVALEAMAMGRPVIAARSGGLADLVVDGETGILTPPGDPAALADAIGRLVADPALRRRYGEAGRRRAATFGEREIVGRLEEIYAELTGSVAAPTGRSREA